MVPWGSARERAARQVPGKATVSDSDILVLHPRRRLGLLLVSGLFTLGGAALIAIGDTTGWLVLGFFALCDLWLLLHMLPSAMCLRLTADGFECRALHRRHFVRWHDVAGFGVASLNEGAHRMVCFNYVPHCTSPRVLRRLSAQSAGYDAGLPDAYGMSPENLAELMSQWLARHSASVPAPAPMTTASA